MPKSSHDSKDGSSKKIAKIKDYKLLDKIGKGAFSKVFKAQSTKTGEYVAIKRINKDSLEKLGKNFKDILQRELMILMQVNNCKNIIQIKDVTRTRNHFYIIFEYCKGGDLSTYLKKHNRLTEKKARNFMKQIANGLKPLNKLRIVHRDLKLSNFLLSEDCEDPIIKICDFGLARQRSSKEASLLLETICGTPIYMAPEILKGNKYDERADLWSMGTILYELIVGHPPFQGKSLADLVEKVTLGRYIIPTSVEISDLCIDLISGLLRSDPTKRFTWKDFFDHPFISKPDDDEERKEVSEVSSEIDSQKISMGIKASKEKAANAIRDNQCYTTEEDDDFKSGMISDLTKDDKSKSRSKDLTFYAEEEDKDSESEENEEVLALKSSSTEYNFYNSDESRCQSQFSSNSSNMQTFKRNFKEPKSLGDSLGVVREASNTAIEEDPDEDINTSKDPSSSNDTRHPGLRQNELSERSENSLSSVQKSDVEKVIEFMRDLLNRCEMIMSFYTERKNLEIIPQEKELAYLCNKITYDLKVFITTFTSIKDIKEETNLQIICDNYERVDITEDLIKRLVSTTAFKNMKESIARNFMALGDEVTKTHDLLLSKDQDFSHISRDLSKFAIELYKEVVILKEEGKEEEADRKYAQATFLFREAYAEHKNSDLSNDNDSQNMVKMEEKKNVKTLACRNSFGNSSPNEHGFEIPNFVEEAQESEFEDLGTAII